MKREHFATHFAKPLKETFGAYRVNWLCTALLPLGKVSLDIVAFENYMAQRQGYNPDQEGSLKDWVTEKYGEDASALVEELIIGFYYWRPKTEESVEGKNQRTLS